MTAMSPGAEQLSPTTGEPVSVVARRNRLGVLLLTVNATTGCLALFISYAYLWSLNVNNAWAPPNNAWAVDWPFWAIGVGALVAGLIMRWGIRGINRGNRGRMIAASLLSALLLVATFVGQVVQMATFPFGPGDGAYASATFWLALSNAGFLAIASFLAFGIMNRTLSGALSTGNSSHATFVSIMIIWIAVVAFFGALFTTTMKASPNTNPPTFGTFRE